MAPTFGPAVTPVPEAKSALLRTNSLPLNLLVTVEPLTLDAGKYDEPTATAVVMSLTLVLVKVDCSLAKTMPDSSICELALLLLSTAVTPAKPATMSTAMMVRAMPSSMMV